MAKVLAKGLKKLGLEAYHGTPHKVDKFSMSKIGTGEGAQAYGHGLYFAESPDTAATYKAMGNENLLNDRVIDRIDSRGDVRFTDGTVSHISEFLPDNAAQSAVKEASFNRPKGASIESQLKRNRDFYKTKAARSSGEEKVIAEAKVKAHEDALSAIGFNEGGNLYKVRLNVSEDELLDWDAPLSEQSQSIRAAVQEIGDKGLFDKAKISISKGNYQDGLGVELVDGKFAPVIGSEIVSTDGVNDLLFESWDEAFNYIKPELAAKSAGISTGADAYRYLVREAGEDAIGQEIASKALSDKGIKGIKYKDAMSRGAEGGTRNFVIFDENVIQIAKENGIPWEEVQKVAKERGISPQQALSVMLGGGIAFGAMTPEEAEAGVLSTGGKPDLLGAATPQALGALAGSSTLAATAAANMDELKELFNYANEQGDQELMLSTLEMMDRESMASQPTLSRIQEENRANRGVSGLATDTIKHTPFSTQEWLTSQVDKSELLDKTPLKYAVPDPRDALRLGRDYYRGDIQEGTGATRAAMGGIELVPDVAVPYLLKAAPFVTMGLGLTADAYTETPATQRFRRLGTQ